MSGWLSPLPSSFRTAWLSSAWPPIATKSSQVSTWGDGDRDGLTGPFTQQIDFAPKAVARLPQSCSLRAFFTTEPNAGYVCGPGDFRRLNQAAVENSESKIDLNHVAGLGLQSLQQLLPQALLFPTTKSIVGDLAGSTGG